MFGGPAGRVLGCFLVLLGDLGGSLERSGGGLGRLWRALGAQINSKSKQSMFGVTFWGVKMDQKSLKIVFKNELVFRRGADNAFDRFVMNL